jgi:hypothetical protein
MMKTRRRTIMKMNATAEELLQSRLGNNLPLIDIAGKDFMVVWEDRMLKPTSGTGNGLDLDNMPLDENGFNYLCFYNLVTQSQVLIPENITRLPEDTILLKIPNELYLDPVGVARDYGQADTFLLNLYPIRENLKAEVIPIELSGLPELIKSNKEKKLAARISKVFKRKKKNGKGL